MIGTKAIIGNIHQHAPWKWLASIVMVLPCASLMAQDIAVPTDREYYARYRQPLPAAHLHVSAGVASPTGTFRTLPATTSSVVAPFTGADGAGGAMGFFMEGEYRSAFSRKEDRKNSVYPFWGGGLTFAKSPLKWQSLGGRWEQQAITDFSQLGITGRLGLAFNVNSMFVVELGYAVVAPVITKLPSMALEAGAVPEGSPYAFSVDPVEGGSVFRPGHLAGAAVRLRRWRVGAEWFRYVPGAEYTYTGYDALGRHGSSFNSHMVWNTWRIGIGMTF